MRLAAPVRVNTLVPVTAMVGAISWVAGWLHHAQARREHLPEMFIIHMMRKSVRDLRVSVGLVEGYSAYKPKHSLYLKGGAHDITVFGI